MRTDHDTIADFNSSPTVEYGSGVNGKAISYLNAVRMGEIYTRIYESKGFNFFKKKFIQTIPDNHALHGRKIAGKPPDILLYPDVRKMAGIPLPESSYWTWLLFHIMDFLHED